MKLTWTHHEKSEQNPEFWAADKDEKIGICFAHQTCSGDWMLKNNTDEWGPFGSFEQAQAKAEMMFGEKPLLTWNDECGGCFIYGKRGALTFFNADKRCRGEKYGLHFYAKGHGEFLGNFTLDEAKARAEDVMREWLRQTKLRPEE